MSQFTDQKWEPHGDHFLSQDSRQITRLQRARRLSSRYSATNRSQVTFKINEGPNDVRET